MLKKIFAILFISVICSLNIDARTFESVYGEDNNFLQMTYFEIEQGLSVYKNNNTSAGEMGIVPITIRYGVMNNMELGLKVPYVFVQNGKNGVADISFFQKFKFVEETQNTPVISGGISFDLPIGDLGYTKNPANPSVLYSMDNKKIDFRFFLSGAKDLPHARVFAGVGFDFIEGGDDTKLDYNIGLNFPITDTLKLTTELFGFKIDSDYMNSEIYGAPGFILQANEKFNIRFAVPFGLNSDSYDYKINFVMTHTF